MRRECVVGTAFRVERTCFGGQLACGDGVTLDYDFHVSKDRCKAHLPYLRSGVILLAEEADPVQQRSGADSASLLDTVDSIEVAVARAGLAEAVDLQCPCCSCPELCRPLQGTVVQHHEIDSLGQAADILLQQASVHMGEHLVTVLAVDLYHMQAVGMQAVEVAAHNPRSLLLVVQDTLLRLVVGPRALH